ncbi:MAG: hypothetical protein A2173_04840 [Planctomycetes bacterium RBG_13_44_8b]|nr:MAG: hypothetical protein A2173_04840 [Planctomycetes bacterium RBG_13_44_8b]
MGALLEIFGRAITLDTAELIWHWLTGIKFPEEYSQTAQHDQLSRIIDLISNTKLDAAQEQLRLYLFENPSCIYGRMAAAAICLHKNQLTDAIEELNSVYLKTPNNTMALYALGHCYERLDKEPQAVEFYQDCLKFKRYLQYPCQRLAAIYFKNGQFEKTIQQYELLKDEYPDDISTLITLGNLYLATAKYNEAIETFNTAILIQPDIFLTENDDIEQLIQEGDLQSALQQLEMLSEQQFDRPELSLRQADVLSMMGETAEAISQYQHALSIFPDFLEATVKLGTHYLHIDAEHLAAQQFNRAFDINDRLVDAYFGIAIGQKLSGNDSDALATLSLASALQSNSSFLFAETAKLLFKNVVQNDLLFVEQSFSNDFLKAAIESHQNQISNQTNNADLFYRLGILYMALGRYNNSIDYFNQTLRINPTFFRAKFKLAICLFETGDKQSALNLLTAPEFLDHDTLLLHYKTALLYCNKFKFASSLLNLSQYLENNFASFNSTCNISLALQNMGLIDRVSSMWEHLSETARFAKQ